MKIWTIGYEGATQHDLIATLRAAGGDDFLYLLMPVRTS